MPLIVLLRLVILLHMPWVYFLLYASVLAYGALLMLSWSIYPLESLSAHCFTRLLLPILAAEERGQGIDVPWHIASGSSHTPICARRLRRVCSARTSGL
jgi:hypothetical protein